MSLYSYQTNLILSSKNDKPKIISTQNYGIPAQNLIFITKNTFNATLPQYEENSEITVCFFYQGRGIFFKTVPKIAASGYGLVIPQVLYKQQDKNTAKQYEVTGKLFYTGKEEKGRFISCFSNPLQFNPLAYKTLLSSVINNLTSNVLETTSINDCTESMFLNALCLIKTIFSFSTKNSKHLH
jgi:hypothetical protein